jgi:protein TonB
MRADGYAPRRRPRWGTVVVVVLLHIAAFAGLMRMFAPGFTATVVERATSLVTVTITAPPEPEPSPEPDAGAAGNEGRKATPREAAAPEAPLPRPHLVPGWAQGRAAR